MRLLLILLLLFACNDQTNTPNGHSDMTVSLAQDAFVPDVQVVEIPDITVDAYVNPCDNLSNTDDLYCDCNPTK